MTDNASSGAVDTVQVRVPAWAKQAVWYQIFPERFRNGDPANDPKLADIAGSWPHETPETWSTSLWTGDWYELQAWEKRGKKDFYFRAQQRRYGGDLQGILDKLDYLQELGINAIYLNPLFESPSLHKYDATMFHHVDNNFGPDPEGDKRLWLSENPADASTWTWSAADKLFLKLVAESHRRGIKVIIDGVFNHVGMTFWAFQDVKKNGQHSPYKNWFTINEFDDPSTEIDEFDYVGWAGIRELPEIREDDRGIVSGPREHIRHIVKRWMDPNGDGNPSDGIDGWRLDVAEKVGLPFWREFRMWVREINPDAYLVGEVWWEDWRSGKMFNAAPWLEGDVFDAVMNYRLVRDAGLFFKVKKDKITATEFSKRIAVQLSEYRDDANRVLMNMMGSHDTDRLASQVVNADTRYDQNTGVQDNRQYDVRKPNSVELRTEKLMLLFQMTYLGAPVVYYGDEAGMWGADDPDCRKPMLWTDMKFKDEKAHPFGKKRNADKNAFDADLFKYYQQLIALRKKHPAFTWGDINMFLTEDEKDVIGFTRMYTGSRVAVVINNSPKQQSVTVTLHEGLRSYKWENLFGGQVAELAESRKETRLTLKLEPKSGGVFHLR